jgi:hypothetical protein
MATTYLSPLGNEQQNDAERRPAVGWQDLDLRRRHDQPDCDVPGQLWLGGAGQSHRPEHLGPSLEPDLASCRPGSEDGVHRCQRRLKPPTVDNITGINDPTGASTADQWVIYQGAPTFISSTSFSVAGDQRNTFQIGRRVRSTNSGGTIYSTITNAVFGASTTVTVVNDSGVLDSGLSQVSYGLLSATNPSSPALGVAQTWQDVKASRSAGTTYTNSTGRPIAVSITSTPLNAADAVKLTVSSTPMFGSSNPTVGSASSIFCVVPSGGTYVLSSANFGNAGVGTLLAWAELR